MYYKVYDIFLIFVKFIRCRKKNCVELEKILQKQFEMSFSAHFTHYFYNFSGTWEPDIALALTRSKSSGSSPWLLPRPVVRPSSKCTTQKSSSRSPRESKRPKDHSSRQRGPTPTSNRVLLSSYSLKNICLEKKNSNQVSDFVEKKLIHQLICKTDLFSINVQSFALVFI